MENLHQNLLLIAVIFLSLGTFGSGTLYPLLNATCDAHYVCKPSESFLRCYNGRCVCSNRDHESFEPNAGPAGGACKLKVNTRCDIPHKGRKGVQPCVNGAECDFPRVFGTEEPLLKADTGNCRCKGDYSPTDKNLCSNSSNVLKSLMSRNQSTSILMFVIITLSLLILS